MTRSIILFALLASQSCDRLPDAPRDGDGTCETAAATLQKLGGCGLDVQNYVAHCHDREKNEAIISARNAETCIQRSASCKEAFLCK